MAFDVEYTEEFRVWFQGDLSAAEQKSVTRVVEMLEDAGPRLRFSSQFRY